MRPAAARRLVANAVAVVTGLLIAPPAATAMPVSDAVASVVGIDTGEAVGTGFVTTAGVVTAAHVVADTRNAFVTVAGERHAAEVTRVDPHLDLALLSVELPDVPPLALDSDPQLGEPVTVVTVDPIAGPVLTRGIVSALPVEFGVPYVQTDAAVNEGTSGAPVLGDDGRVLGVVVTKDPLRDDVGRAHTAGDVEAFLARRSTTTTGEPVANRGFEPASPPPLSPYAPIAVAGAVVGLAAVGIVRGRAPKRRDDIRIELGPITAVEDQERPTT